MSDTNARALNWTEQGYVPDVAIRHGIRRLVRQRLQEIQSGDSESVMSNKLKFIELMNNSEIAPLPQKANEQHYEVPAQLYLYTLGENLKYSCSFWDYNTKTLNQAENDSLKTYAERAHLHNGQEILELGCGWGSLTLWMARHFPDSKITAVSNSHSQRKFILDRARHLFLSNIEVITCDMNEFEIENKFDRVVSIEMFEHMRNWQVLFQKVSRWLKPDGKFFMHIFTHRDAPYEFAVRDESDWMSRFFFSGGMMPSDDLPLYFQDHLKLTGQWRWDGTHYQKTAEAWLANMDRHKELIWPTLEATYGRDEVQKWWMRWRIFFMACAELFGYDNGQQWWVSHYLFENKSNG